MADLSEFDEFVVGCLPRLSKSAWFLTGNRDDAADLCQEALLQVRLRWRTVDVSMNAEAYAVKALTRLHLNRLRSLRRQRGAYARAATRAEQDRYANVELSHDLSAALDRLGRRQRATVVLRYVAGYSVNEVASILDCSPGTVKSQAARALQMLRVELSYGYQVEGAPK